MIAQPLLFICCPDYIPLLSHIPLPSHFPPGDPADHISIDLHPHPRVTSSSADAAGDDDGNGLELDIPGVKKETVSKLLQAGCKLYLM